MRRLDEEFRLPDGGGWFYVEIDNGFPWANVEALIQEVGHLRGLSRRAPALELPDA